LAELVALVAVRRQAVLLVAEVKPRGDADLAQVARTGRAAGLGPDRADDRDEQAREHADDGDDREQLDQSEGAARAHG
jgi:hypothetical protein